MSVRGCAENCKKTSVLQRQKLFAPTNRKRKGINVNEEINII